MRYGLEVWVGGAWTAVQGVEATTLAEAEALGVHLKRALGVAVRAIAKGEEQ